MTNQPALFKCAISVALSGCAACARGHSDEVGVDINRHPGSEPETAQGCSRVCRRR